MSVFKEFTYIQLKLVSFAVVCICPRKGKPISCFSFLFIYFLLQAVAIYNKYYTFILHKLLKLLKFLITIGNKSLCWITWQDEPHLCRLQLLVSALLNWERISLKVCIFTFACVIEFVDMTCISLNVCF